jgi:hypothetical protein
MASGLNQLTGMMPSPWNFDLAASPNPQKIVPGPRPYPIAEPPLVGASRPGSLGRPEDQLTRLLRAGLPAMDDQQL